jgi:hypothetical protein
MKKVGFETSQIGNQCVDKDGSSYNDPHTNESDKIGKHILHLEWKILPDEITQTISLTKVDIKDSADIS